MEIKPIKNERDYEESLKRLEEIFDSKKETKEGDELEILSILIDKYEQNERGYYGGCIGFIGFNGTVNQAITIRTFLSKNNTLYYRAGAGIVSKSNEEKELNEVNHKLSALKEAIERADLHSQNMNNNNRSNNNS